MSKSIGFIALLLLLLCSCSLISAATNRLVSEDEELVDTVKNSAPTAAATGSLPLSSKSSSTARVEPENYFYEYLAVTFLVLYLANYFYSRGANEKLAIAYINSILPTLEKNFSAVGLYSQETKAKNEIIAVQAREILIKDSNSLYKLFCSGRRNTVGCLISLQFQPNYDFLYQIYYLFDNNNLSNKNLIHFDITLHSLRNLPLIFALIRKKNALSYKKNNPDLNDLASIAKQSSRLPNNNNFSIITDTFELANNTEILEDNIVKMIENFPQLLWSIHLTDQPKPILRVSLQFPRNSNDLSGLVTLTKMIFYLIDRVSGVELSGAAFSKNSAIRKSIAEKVEKEEKMKKLEEIKAKRDQTKAGDSAEKNVKQKKPKLKVVR
jgi:hypothetical protein